MFTQQQKSAEQNYNTLMFVYLVLGIGCFAFGYYFIERGIDPLFAIKTMSATSDDMWFPRRKELEKANVITVLKE